ncbi:MAG TPA: hypothetical protein VLU38_01680 [Methanomassiliicoccales archaeon]|nr:hypothetical protein [Methanomassiliicoccales archaeon]
MPEDKEDGERAKPISSRMYFILAVASFLLSVPFFFFLHPVTAFAAVVIGIFLIAGGFFSMANERHWLD